MASPSQHWGIVGGGMLGMTLAFRLAQAGHRVTILEAADRLGGLASPWSLGDIVWDRHYHVTLLSDTANRGLLRELGLEQDMKWVEARTGFFVGGKLFSMSNTVEFLRFPPLSVIGMLRLGGTIFYASRIRNWRRLERVPVATWLRRWSGRATFEAIWLPLLRAKLGESYRRTSAAFIWATINRLYAARRSGFKKELFGYLPGGYARILARFADALAAEGVRVRLERPTAGVSAHPDGGIAVRAADGGVERFDEVVLTMAAPDAVRVCPGLTAGEKARLEGVSYQGIICASLLLKKPISPYYVTNITDSWVPFTGVIEMSALVDPAQFNGLALVYLPKYVDPQDPAFARTDADLEEEFLSALERMYPSFSRADVVCFKVSRVRRVFALPTVGYSDRLPSTTTSIPGLHIINSAHIVNGTLNVNETVQLAETSARRLLASGGRTAPPGDTPPPR